MAEEKKINMPITESEVKQMLIKHLDIQKPESVANVIIGHLIQTEKGLGQLFKALVGIFPSAKYMPGQFVWVKISAISTWQYNMDASKELPTYKDDVVLGQITDINVYEAYSYKILFDAIRSGKPAPTKETMSVAEEYIVEKAENFTDILDDLEKKIEDKDLPF